MAQIGTGQSSTSLYAALVAGLAGALFLGIVMWPSGADQSLRMAQLDATPLSTTLDDPITHRYLTALQRVKPSAARRLHQDADKAIAGGADANAVALMVLESHSHDWATDAKHLLRADVKHFDKMLRMSQTGFATLSSQAPEYCRLAQYQRFEHMAPDAIADEISTFLDYGTPGYLWLMRFNLIVLDGIEDGRTSPKKYDRLNVDDQQVLSAKMMKMMNRPQIAKVMQLQSRPESEQRRAMMNMNICTLATDVLSEINTLPTETKTRLLGELQYQVRNGDFGRIMRAVQNGI